MAVHDYHDFFNSVKPGAASVPSHVSFDVRWPGKGERHKIRDKKFRFTGQFVTSATTISFTASNHGSGVTYTSEPKGQYNPTTDQNGAGLPAVGHERNGVFFR